MSKQTGDSSALILGLLSRDRSAFVQQEVTVILVGKSHRLSSFASARSKEALNQSLLFSSPSLLSPLHASFLANRKPISPVYCHSCYYYCSPLRGVEENRKRNGKTSRHLAR